MKSFTIGLLVSSMLFLLMGQCQASTTIYPWEYRYENCSTATDGTDHTICVDTTSAQLFKCSTSGGTCLTLISTHPNVITVAQSATPTLNITNENQATFSITGLAQAITSFTMSGTPTNGETIVVQITDNGTSQNITWGSSFISSLTLLPAATQANKMISVVAVYDATSGEWICKGAT